MKSGISRIRNPVIARVFRELGLTEQCGSGIKRIFESAAQQGLPEPLIEEIATGIGRVAQANSPSAGLRAHRNDPPRQTHQPPAALSADRSGPQLSRKSAINTFLQAI